ncbi:universal stress protein [Bacillus sp. FJAT-45350]|uniref:universal stress protein n=1 Tax=Bacillus sp. FJAT-45350 TaxID=2011014 RepID=UPI000BB7FA6D|nr:universal stress protein [Bacillus sp. FJAT-45350]
MFSFYSRIVIAYDGSSLGKKALSMAKELAQQDKRVEIHVLNVINPKYLGSEFGVYDAIKEEQQKKIERILDEVKETLQPLENKQDYVILKGNPAEMIIDYAKNRDVDLIVIGSRGLSKFKEMVLGSVSHNVVQHAHCPVLIAK